MEQYLNGVNFAEIADYQIIICDGKQFDPKILYKNAIIYCKIDYIEYLFANLKNSFNKYILITHMSDYPVDFYRYSMKPSCIKKWYGQNVIVRNEDVIPIPIGLENQSGCQKGNFSDYNWFKDNIERLKEVPKDNSVVYCNWNKDNNKKDRDGVLDKLKVPYKWDERLTFYEYCENMSKHKFVISPPGNGMDCHRTWEAIYMGCIPIVIKNHIYDEWKELPIIQVRHYSEVNEELLKQSLEKSYNIDKAFIPYWKNRIKEDFKKL